MSIIQPQSIEDISTTGSYPECRGRGGGGWLKRKPPAPPSMKLGRIHFFATTGNRLPVVARFTVCGIFLGVIATQVPEVLGMGYDTVNAAVLGDIAVTTLALLALAGEADSAGRRQRSIEYLRRAVEACDRTTPGHCSVLGSAREDCKRLAEGPEAVAAPGVLDAVVQRRIEFVPAAVGFDHGEGRHYPGQGENDDKKWFHGL